ncbi:MAG: hypothetical protein E7514_03595 [Ruminococcaceae bacterium]|nr:hypothetical protein [Oscillospiraceae bacterium]
MDEEKVLTEIPDSAEDGKVPTGELFAYTAALTGQNLTYHFVNQWIFYFCTNVIGISPIKVGFLTGFSKVWDALNDPIVGTLIDRRRTKPGQKLHPYLGKLPVIIGILTALMFVDFGLGETAAMVIFLCIYIAWDLTYSFQDVALWGMMALISPKSHERERVSQWLNIGVAAAIGAVGLIPLIKGTVEANSGRIEASLGITEARQMTVLFLAFGIVFGFGGELMSILAYKTKERVAFVNTENRPFKEDIKALFRNKMLLLLLLAQLVNFIGGAIPWIYFFDYCVSFNFRGTEINGSTAQFIYGLLISVFSTVSMFFAVKISDRIGGMRNIIIIAQIMNVICRIAAYFAGFNSTKSIVAVIVIMAISSIPANMVGIAQRALLSDAINYEEWKTGKRTEGVSNSMQNLTNKLGDALKLIAAGVILSALGFSADKGITGQPEIFYKAQWPLFMLLPALGSILYLIPFMFIRYSKVQREQVERELEQRHLEALTQEKEA